jgi:2,4-dienoyl-CoA reductase-like NADH-dependent reductase (Old Yellow Enzyme family)/thioredoxin reductase
MKLSDPIQIKNCHFSNRAVMAPMVTNSAALDGSVTQEYENFYLARARSQVGYIVLGASYVHPDGKGFQRQLGVYDDRLMPGLKKLAASLAQHTRVGIQLSFKSLKRMPQDFSRNEIKDYRQAFVAAAIRAQTCGFDAIELHACHDYWLNFFLSPHFNDRQDSCGGDLENRFRLLKETTERVRSAIGGDMLLGVRLSVDEFVEDGLTLEETLKVGDWLEALGVDYLSASGGIGLTQYRMSPPMEVERGSLLHLARSLKEKISIPVIGVGRLDRPSIFEEALIGGHADFAAAARAMIADPDYVVKILDGRPDDIRPCIACNFCLLCLHRDEPVRCAVNPYIGKDLYVLKSLRKPSKIMVIGGGPAGLAAAATAARRGANVKLFEKQPELGGTVNLGKKPPFKESLQDLIEYLVKQTRKSGVSVNIGEEVTAETVQALKPDHIIIATGASDLPLEVKGLNSHPAKFSALQILRWEKTPEGNYLIIGGGAVGLELAEYLAASGRGVTVIEMTGQLGHGLHATRLNLMVERLASEGVRILKDSTLTAVIDKCVEIKTANEKQTLDSIDFIVSAVGYRSNTRLAEEINKDIPATVIGDANRPGTIFEAIRDGFNAAAGLQV